MRLNEVLEHPDLKNADITVIGTYKTGEKEYSILGKRGEKVLPVPKIFHLVDDGPKNMNPELEIGEIRTIWRRFLKIEYPSRISTPEEI